MSSPHRCEGKVDSDECVGGQSLKPRVSGGGGPEGWGRGRGGRELRS